MKKILILILLNFVSFSNYCQAKDTIQFTFPEGGWHKVLSPDKQENKKCYVPYNQTSDNYRQMLIFYERTLQNTDITASAILQKQLGKDRNNYKDIIPKYITQDSNDTMVTWCSKIANTCTIKRAFQGNDGIIIVTFINRTPHYSQNMFGRWSNILSTIKITNKNSSDNNMEIIQL